MVESFGGGGFGGGNGFGNNGNNNNGRGDKWSNLGALFKMGDISEKTRQHLVRVYSTLMTSTGACAGGMVLNSGFLFGGGLVGILSFVLMCYLMYQVHNRNNSEDHRILFLVGLAFFMGLTAGPAIHMTATLSPEILIQAIIYTFVAFGSFSGIALFSQRRSMLFLGGIISTMMSTLFVYSLMGMVFGANPLGGAYVFISLFMTCLWIIFDTQKIVEQSEAGNRDVPTHSLELFIDLFELFIKLLRMLEKMNENQNKKKK
jgi:FtsH-binding integral membrane protein